MNSAENKAYVLSLTDDKCDPILGAKVQSHLKRLGLENPMLEGSADSKTSYYPDQAVREIMNGIYGGLDALGINMKDPSMSETPKRYAHMLVGELTKGLCYDLFPKCTVTPNGTTKHGWTRGGPGSSSPNLVLEGTPGAWEQNYTIGKYDEMVLVKGIQVMSLCEHHLQTIDGFAHIAYLPKDKLLGLSKFARVTEFFSRRPQVQERLTTQIAASLQMILETEDIAVVISAQHYCMKARGSMQQSSMTQTNYLGGRFRDNAALRTELLNAIAN